MSRFEQPHLGTRLRPRALLRLLAIPAVAGGLAAVLTRLPHLWGLTLFDVDIYLTIGQQWWEGVVPYRDLFDLKGPFLYELFAVLSAIAHPSLFALRLIALGAFLVSVWQLGALAGRHGGRVAAWCASVAYGIAGSAIAFEGPDPNADQWALIGLVACVDFADRFGATGRRRWAVAAGVSLALIAGIKLAHLVMAPLVAVLLLSRPGRRLAGAAGALAGFAGATAAILVPIALAGALGDLRFILLEYGPRFVSAAADDLRHAGWRAQVSWLLGFPSIALLVAGLALGAVGVRDGATRRLALLGLAWLCAAWLYSHALVRGYAHYFIVTTPPLALLIGTGIAAIVRRAPGVRTATAAVVLTAVCLPLAIDGWLAAIRTPPDRRWMALDLPMLSRVDDAARIVRRITRPGERVYVASGNFTNGGEILYWLAERRPADRLMFPWDMVPQRYEEVGARLARRPPAVLVIVPGAPTEAYRGAIANGGLEVVERLPDAQGGELVIMARPTASSP